MMNGILIPLCILTDHAVILAICPMLSVMNTAEIFAITLVLVMKSSTMTALVLILLQIVNTLCLTPLVMAKSTASSPVKMGNFCITMVLALMVHVWLL